MKHVRTAGGIAVLDGRILLITKGGKYNIPKGHIDDGESDEQAAIRELLEETGYDVRIIRPLGSLARPSVEDDGETVEKEIVVFLMSVVGQRGPARDETPAWIETAEAVKRMYYEEERDFIEHHISDILPVHE